MSKSNFYTLPELKYKFKDLEPYISENQLQIHYEKHHQAYVRSANSILEKIDKARKARLDLDMKAVLKELSFNIGGHLLHSLFWQNMAPSKKNNAEPGGVLKELLKKEFGSFERFKQEFAQTALSVEGSGWAALAFCSQTARPINMQIEKHNNNIYPAFSILMVLDVFEHAYYLDYRNDRTKFIEAFWNIVNWEEVEKRFKKAAK
ncbi:MAG: superoxide dismutase [Candidatus Portnoybacteria bacterium]|nr:superoxide dismutase [Candidatus Portnoybacteria bacterium]